MGILFRFVCDDCHRSVNESIGDPVIAPDQNAFDVSRRHHIPSGWGWVRDGVGFLLYCEEHMKMAKAAAQDKLLAEAVDLRREIERLRAENDALKAKCDRADKEEWESGRR